VPNAVSFWHRMELLMASFRFLPDKSGQAQAPSLARPSLTDPMAYLVLHPLDPP
jgi:hypothetical protein